MAVLRNVEPRALVALIVTVIRLVPDVLYYECVLELFGKSGAEVVPAGGGSTHRTTPIDARGETQVMVEV